MPCQDFGYGCCNYAGGFHQYWEMRWGKRTDIVLKMYWENEMQELLETQDPDNEETYDGLVSEYEKVFA
jgi:hypothetical protein